MAKPKPFQLPRYTEIEVVMTKHMTITEYEKMFQKAKEKGWKIQAYQKGFRN
ncbi:hypothetical protein [Tenacibaculum sp. MAR_2009_124]|uniref:hypothetical protein n=1 Tax=Tenacibaculum sp. MAR_2009_124 TaxID=1250059 RepID=UPI0015A46CF6|nr:hypothetical protein [Tenacibaculum sp. MAR_2009_124]